MDQPTSSPPPKVEPYSLPRRVRAIVGDIILLGGEIDHLVSMALLGIADVRPVNGLILLDRQSIGNRLKMLKFFTETHNNLEIIEAFTDFERSYKFFSTVRNAIAHGLYIGREVGTQDYAFSNPQDYIPTDGTKAYYNKVVVISEKNLSEIVRDGQKAISKLREAYGVRSLHDMSPSRLQRDKPIDQKSQRKNNHLKSKRQRSPFLKQ